MATETHGFRGGEENGIASSKMHLGFLIFSLMVMSKPRPQAHGVRTPLKDELRRVACKCIDLHWGIKSTILLAY